MAQYDYTKVKELVQAAGYGTELQSSNAEDDAINAAWLELASEREWSWLQTRITSSDMTIGSEVVPQPADLVVPSRVRLSIPTASYTLQKVSAEVLQARLDADLPATQGVPIEWAWVRNTILVWPRPDRAYDVTLDYIKSPDPAAFDSGSEALGFLDDRFATVLAWGAIRWLAFRQRDQVFYGIATQEWDRAKANMSAADRRGEPDHVVEWDGWSQLPGYGER
jgi:hypothetical protein